MTWPRRQVPTPIPWIACSDTWSVRDCSRNPHPAGSHSTKLLARCWTREFVSVSTSTGIGGRMAHAWSSLLVAVRTGAPAYHTVFGRPFWEDLEAHPDLAASFDGLMGPAGHGTPDPEVLVSGGWESVHTVVDVGGGTGSLLAEILRARPTIRGTLVDLPGTVARSGEIFQAAGVSDRVTTVGQSFFDPLPSGADLYLLKNLLADWPDGEATRDPEKVRGSGMPWRTSRGPWWGVA